MSKLNTSDYETIVRKALGIHNAYDKQFETIEEIIEYFHYEYVNHKDTNPNFKNELQDAVQYFKANNLLGVNWAESISKIKRACDKFNLSLSEIQEVANNEELQSHTNLDFTKLKWKGTPAHFAFFIDLLINKGYLEKPTTYAERNAELFLRFVEFTDYNPSKESLGRLLHKDDDPIKNAEHKARFLKIPHRTELDK